MDCDREYRLKYVEGEIFAFSSYPGHAPTFQVKLKNGAIFSYLPIVAFLSFVKPDEHGLTMMDLCYNNCPDENIAINYYRALQGPVSVYFKRFKKWFKGKYHFTIDWYQCNECAHFIELEHGEFCLLPNHKVIFGNKEQILPPYKALHAEWRLK